jgi:DNA-binding IclR family transcriptional regulator
MGDTQDEVLEILKILKKATTRDISERTGMSMGRVWRGLNSLTKWDIVRIDKTKEPYEYHYIEEIEKNKKKKD